MRAVSHVVMTVLQPAHQLEQALVIQAQPRRLAACDGQLLGERRHQLAQIVQAVEQVIALRGLRVGGHKPRTVAPSVRICVALCGGRL